MERVHGSLSLAVLGSLICDVSDEDNWGGPVIDGLSSEYDGWTKKTEAYVLALRDAAKRGNKDAEQCLAALVGLMNTTRCPRKEASHDVYLNRWLTWARQEVTPKGEWPADADDDELEDEECLETGNKLTGPESDERRRDV